MQNILVGIQYRQLNPALPSWNKAVYTDWVDAKAGDHYFPTGTQFRIKPSFIYEVVVTDSGAATARIDLSTSKKDSAMARLAQLLEEGKTVAISKNEKTTPSLNSFLSDKNIQFKQAGSDKWSHPNYLSTSGQAAPVHFRIRPDLYWEVTTSGAVSKSVLTFDDVEALHDYVDRQIRTSDFNIYIRKLRYE